MIIVFLLSCARTQKFGDLEGLGSAQIGKETVLPLLKDQWSCHLGIDPHVLRVLKLVENQLFMHLPGEVTL
jgi:hypothetical protein